MPAVAPRIELLGGQHDRAGFACGKEALDQYFQRQVTQDARRRLASPFVMVMPGGSIGGYYTLSSTAVRLHDLPEELARRLPRYPLVPAILIGRLAIDRRYHGQGWAASCCSTRSIAAPPAKSPRSPSSSMRSTMTRGPSTCTTAFFRSRIRPTACSGAWRTSLRCSDKRAPWTCRYRPSPSQPWRAGPLPLPRCERGAIAEAASRALPYSRRSRCWVCRR